MIPFSRLLWWCQIWYRHHVAAIDQRPLMPTVTSVLMFGSSLSLLHQVVEPWRLECRPCAMAPSLDAPVTYSVVGATGLSMVSTVGCLPSGVTISSLPQWNFLGLWPSTSPLAASHHFQKLLPDGCFRLATCDITMLEGCCACTQFLTGSQWNAHNPTKQVLACKNYRKREEHQRVVERAAALDGDGQTQVCSCAMPQWRMQSCKCHLVSFWLWRWFYSETIVVTTVRGACKSKTFWEWGIQPKTTNCGLSCGSRTKIFTSHARYTCRFRTACTL